MPQLSRREYVALLCGGIAVLATLFYLGILSPYQQAMAQLDHKIASRRQQLESMQGLREEYLQLRGESSISDQRLHRGTAFSLISFLETLTSTEATRENLTSMRPQTGAAPEGFREESVELKLEKIRLDQLVRILYAIDTAEAYLQIKNLRVRTRFDNRSLLDVVLTVSSYGKNL